MWVSKKTDWSKKHTDLTKYFIEKVKQQVDYDEIISNKHRTTNGFTLIKEIIDVAELTLKRRKSYRRLESLLLESTDALVRSNIRNDYILQKYHNDIPEYYNDIKNKIKDDENLIKDILLKSKIFYFRLEKDYFENIKFELKSIDYESKEFYRESDRIDLIISNLIPYLLFIGYSPTSISDIAYRMVKKDFGIQTTSRFLSHFDNKRLDYSFLIFTNSESEEFQHFKDYFDRKNIDYSSVNLQTFNRLRVNRNLDLQPSEQVFEIHYTCLDPHNFIRNLYEKTIRKHILEQSRTSLSFFNTFFDKIFWRFSKSELIYQPSNIKVDPINIKRRKSTLHETLKLISEENNFNYQNKLPIIPDIQDSVYYYNLALGSKSIENSLLLFWSSLESLIPYRFKATDIENVQYFVSKSLSVGAIGRLISSFSFRLIDSSEFDKNIDYHKLGIKPEIIFKSDKFSYWAVWLSDDTKIKTPDDPFNTFKSASNLLCKQYTYLNDLFSGYNNVFKVKDLAEKINASQKSIEYQLDRIYLHRNQIVHSGKFINEYSNLWLHLEWYVGKLLSYCFLKYYEDPNSFEKERVFMELEGDHDLVLNLIKNHKDKPVKDIGFAFNKLLQHTWQFF